MIYASKYIYEGDVAAWPGVAINYTTKTQYLFRINKGVENHWNNADINKYMSAGVTSYPVSANDLCWRWRYRYPDDENAHSSGWTLHRGIR